MASMAVWERDSTWTLVAVPLTLSLKPHNSSSPVWLQHPLSCHLFTGARVSACRQDFVCFPFKRIPGFLAISHLTQVDRNSHWFSLPDVIWALLPGSGVLGWWAWLGVETPYSSRGTLAAEVCLWILSHYAWVRGQPFSISDHPLPHQSWGGFFCKSLVISFQLVFRWSSRLIVFSFSCNCDVALGGGECKLLLIHHRGLLYNMIQLNGILLWIFGLF